MISCYLFEKILHALTILSPLTKILRPRLVIMPSRTNVLCLMPMSVLDVGMFLAESDILELNRKPVLSKDFAQF